MNLVDLVRNQIGGDMIGRIGSLLGVDNEDAKSAVDAGVPALLAGFGGLASTNDGAKRLASAVNGFDDRLAGNVANALEGGAGNSVIDSGRNLLGSLMGNNMLSGLGGALSRFTGLGAGAVTSLLGLLAPMVLGTLKRQKGVDAGGLANLFSGQRQNIMGALPAGLGGMLGNVPGLSGLAGLGDTARDVAGSVYATGRTAAATTTSAAASAGSSVMRWLVPVAVMLAITGLIWWAINRGGPNTVNARPGTIPSNALTTPNTGMTAAVEEQVTRLTGQAKDFFTSATASLGKITDTASAEAALPQLRELAGKLDSLRSAAGSLPAGASDRINSLVSQSWPALLGAIDKVMVIPGVGDVLRPTLDQIRNSISAFARP